MNFLGKRVWLALLVVVAMTIAACGGGGADDAVTEAQWVKAELAAFQGNGSYWNPALSGTGFFFEAQGGLGVATFYMYEANGRSVWYSALGNLTPGAGAKYQFQGQLLRYAGGQAANSTVARLPTSTVVGSVTVAFDGENAIVSLPGRSYSASKFHRAGEAGGPAAWQPETGIYWNPAESGRGYTIEVNKDYASVAVFHYDSDGQPIWHLVGAQLPGSSALAASGNFVSFSGGQTLTSSYRQPTQAPQGTFSLSFLEACKGKVGFPGMAQVPVQRFAFGSLAPGKECRTPPEPVIPATTAPAVVPTTIFSDVQLAVASPAELRANYVLGGTVVNTFTFSAAGNFASLNGMTVYVIVEDPEGFYTSRAPPAVLLNKSPPGATVILSQRPLQRTGVFQGRLRFYACLTPTCSTQIAGSPLVVPYNFTVR